MDGWEQTSSTQDTHTNTERSECHQTTLFGRVGSCIKGPMRGSPGRQYNKYSKQLTGLI